METRSPKVAETLGRLQELATREPGLLCIRFVDAPGETSTQRALQEHLTGRSAPPPTPHVNPKYKYKTPTGVYAFPLVSQAFTDLETYLKGDGRSDAKLLTFADVVISKRWIQVLRPRPRLLPSMWDRDDPLAMMLRHMHGQYAPDDSMDNDKADKALDLVRQHWTARQTPADEPFGQIIHEAATDAKVRSPFGLFFNITRNLAQNPHRWTYYMRLGGVKAIFDWGTGLIHPNEPTQALFLEPSAYEHIATIPNPVVLQQNRIGRDTLDGLRRMSTPKFIELLGSADFDPMQAIYFGGGTSLYPYALHLRILWLLINRSEALQTLCTSPGVSSDLRSVISDVISAWLYNYSDATRNVLERSVYSDGRLRDIRRIDKGVLESELQFDRRTLGAHFLAHWDHDLDVNPRYNAAAAKAFEARLSKVPRHIRVLSILGALDLEVYEKSLDAQVPLGNYLLQTAKAETYPGTLGGSPDMHNVLMCALTEQFGENFERIGGVPVQLPSDVVNNVLQYRLPGWMVYLRTSLKQMRKAPSELKL